MAQLVACHPTKQKVTGLIPGQGKCVSCEFGPWTGCVRETTTRSFSPSLPPSPKFLERREGRERNINVWLPLMHPLLGTWPTTQAWALTGNQTIDPLVSRPALNLLGHTSQDLILFLNNSFINISIKIIGGEGDICLPIRGLESAQKCRKENWRYSSYHLSEFITIRLLVHGLTIL